MTEVAARVLRCTIATGQRYLPHTDPGGLDVQVPAAPTADWNRADAESRRSLRELQDHVG
jgi:hypothetical protein